MTDLFVTNVECLRSLTLSVIPGLQWRHHGIGLLQGYVSENCDPEVRVHIWDPLLVKPGIDQSGDVHDHRFDLVSHVLAGVVQHEEWHVVEAADGDHMMTKLTHARAAADTNYHGPTEPLPGLFRVQKVLFSIAAGETYRFPAGRFHRSPVTGLAVTVVEKHRQRDVSARLLHPVAAQPVMAFGHEVDPLLVRDVVARACEALGGVPR